MPRPLHEGPDRVPAQTFANLPVREVCRYLPGISHDWTGCRSHVLRLVHPLLDNNNINNGVLQEISYLFLYQPLTRKTNGRSDMPTGRSLAGYRVYVGTRSGVYGFAGPFEVTNSTTFTVPNLPVGTTYFFAVSAFDKAGNESAKSNEVSKSLF